MTLRQMIRWLLREDQPAEYVSDAWLADRSRWENRQGVEGPRWRWPVVK